LELVRALAGPSVAVALVTGAYAAGAVVGTGLVAALITGAVATSGYAATVFFWVLAPREREALQQVAVQA